MPYEGDPIADTMDLLILAALGVAAYFVWELYMNPDSAIAQGACNSLGVGCAPGVVPTSGLGAWAYQAGWWWGNVENAAGNAASKVSSTVDSTTSATRGLGDLVGSVVTGGPATPSAPAPGLPAGYDPATGTVGTAPSGAGSSW